MSSRNSRRFLPRMARAAGLCAVGGLLYSRWTLRANGVTDIEDDNRGPVALPSREDVWQHFVTKEGTQNIQVEQRGGGAMSDDSVYDLCVVGGGMLGLYTAIDAAQRGLTVALLEAEDFGSSQNAFRLGMMPGGFPSCQRAIKQRDVSFLWEAILAMKDITIWSNVAPDLLIRTRTLLPALHQTESVEMRLTALISSTLSIFVGPWLAGRRHRATDAPVACSSSNNDGVLAPLKKSVIVQDATIDYDACVSAMVRLCKRMGVDVINYASVVDLKPKTIISGDNEAASIRITDISVLDRYSNLSAEEVRRPRTTTVRARTVVNATGAWSDTLRSHISLAEGECTSLYQRHSVATYFVVPRDQLRVVAADGAVDAPLFERSTSATSPNVRDAVVTSSSALTTLAAVSIVPFGDDAFLVGAAPSILPSLPSVTSFPVGGKPPIRVSDLKKDLETVTQQAKRVCVDIHGVGSVVHVLMPILSPPTVLGEQVANEVLSKGHHILPSRSCASVFHIVGGSLTSCRRVAEDAVDHVVAEVERCRPPPPPPSTGRLIRPCRTQWLRLTPPPAPEGKHEEDDVEAHSTSYKDRVKHFIEHDSALSVVDIIARRTQSATSDPQGTLNALPALAESMGEVLHWTPGKVAEEVARGRAYLKSIMMA